MSVFFLIVIMLIGKSIEASVEIDRTQSTSGVEQSEKECDFSKYNPKKASDFPGSNQVVKKVAPKYPALAQKSRIQGQVGVKILIDRKGNVIFACAMTGHPLLKKSAVEASLKWKFKPWCSACRKNAVVETVVEFNFNLDEANKEVKSNVGLWFLP